jgi:hypothetical protein
MMELVGVLEPDEWAAMLLAGPRLTKEELAESLRAAVERGAAREREACADVAREHACRTLSECCACGSLIARAIDARRKP